MDDQKISIGWLARNGINRYRPLFMGAETALFLIGCLFWADTVMGGNAFTAEVWGHLAFSVPAIYWAGINMGVSALTLAGLVKPVRNGMVLTGAGLSCVQYMVLSWSAVFDGGAAVIGLYASVFFLPLHMWILFEAATNGDR